MKQGSISTMHRATNDAISAMCAKAHENALSKVDVVLPAKSVNILEEPIGWSGVHPGYRQAEVRMPDGGDVKVKFDKIAQDQLASFCAPGAVAYLRHCAMEGRFDLIADNLNAWLKESPKLRMLRMTKTENSAYDYVVRSFHSEQYARIDNELVLDYARPILENYPALEVKSLNLGNNDMSLKFTTPRVRGEVTVGDIVESGSYARNNEVGKAPLEFSQYLGRLVCLNGMVSDFPLERIHRRHKGRKLGIGILPQFHEVYSNINSEDGLASYGIEAEMIQGLREQLKRAINSALDHDVFRSQLEKLSQSARQETALSRFSRADFKDHNAFPALRVLEKDFGALADYVKTEIHQNFAADGDHTKWGFANAITKVANEAKAYSTATELEQLGGKVVALNDYRWKAYQEAKPLAEAA